MCNKLPINTGKEFKVGQKVYAYYHFDLMNVINPPFPAVVIAKFNHRKPHLFSQEEDGLCDWYFVRSDTGILVLYPETCLEDLREKVFADTARNLESIDRVGEKGSPFDSCKNLVEWNCRAHIFLMKPI